MLEQVLDSEWKAVHLDNSLCGIGSYIGWVFFYPSWDMASLGLPDQALNCSMSGKGEFHCSTQSEDVLVWDEALNA